ncbi:uncharacterized protein Z519_04257 [Cladophialophora bantiana CBS 173.52]|uniref:Uncharacterized protein n=1 Tax=Cladophialophora bantiana (strain ATCC 10958 / CBS 173.52 / CDC B-1940 / NIH 8579) TaxID=1442370 RepID=A0A0D2GAQ6_CLAB1|nr:uncharacterized protein Z519_04257 [Cladophialophora bantiana CBS 173.52]KIW95672.1 hypothetical protein Z519_04257 [Cladophialophora bantiana CBS 173.52]
MDEPFRKRPRLSMFASRSSDSGLDDELNNRRLTNDLLLKSRFESIFEKYSHDFSGVGDEIDMETMSIVVNNGHVQSMENETDPGGAHNTKGKSLLRAMTEVQEGEDDYLNERADGVIMSIEEIAENAAMADDDQGMETVDSDEELFVPFHARAAYITPSDSQQSQNTVQSSLVDSDNDSLFGGQNRPDRSTSPDSLFEVQFQESPKPETTDKLLQFEDLNDEVDGNAILEKFGPKLGPEVLKIMQKARNVAVQAHIEPAWRIPTDLVPSEPPRSLSLSKTPSVPLSASEVQRTASPTSSKSLWKSRSNWSTKRTVRQALERRYGRAESVDPLQEDFSDYQDEKEHSPDSEAVSEGQDEEQRMSKRKNEDDEQILRMRKGSCFYCSRKWAGRAGVFKHWAKLAKDYDAGKIEDDDVHDLEYIHLYVAYSVRTARPPRLTLSDFKTLVELHDGAGLSFNEIAECRALRTHKTGIALNDVYDRYRTRPGHLDNDSRKWSQKELDALEELCQNPKRDIGALRSHFKHRNHSEIGDKLAEIWLAALRSSVQTSPTAPRKQTNTKPQPSGECQTEYRQQEELPPGPPFVKVEPNSDEELFGRR